MDKIILHYIGNGSLIEVPARDLTQADLSNIAWTGWDADKLIATSLYASVEQENDTQYRVLVPDEEIKETPVKGKRGK